MNTGCPNRNDVEVVETLPERVDISDFVEVIVVTPTSSKSE